MKISLYTIFSLAIILFQCCSQENAKKNNGPVVILMPQYNTLDNFHSGKFKVYKAKNNIFPLFDSIIENVSMSEKIKNKQIVYTFAVNTTLYCDTTIFIGVNDYKHADILCHEADALFFYQGYLFIYNGIFIDMFFEDISKAIDSNKPIEIPEDEHITDDTLLPLFLWQYRYKNGILRFVDRL